MATTSVAAAASAAANATVNAAVHPPASPFAELLRRSRFAAFDSNIRQTYSTPPAYAHRGNWGLKRPLALRRRNAFITLPAPFEDRAQYIEWNKAESEVRFIRRFEEMEVRPQIKADSAWFTTLGKKNQNEWLLDSEFCHRHEGPEVEERVKVDGKEKDNEAQLTAQTEQEVKVKMQKTKLSTDLNEFGEEGEGNYGHKRPQKRPQKNVSYLTPNIDAMSPKEFERYLHRLRELRPKFKKYLQSISTPGDQLASQSLFSLAQNSTANHYHDFLQTHYSEQFADIQSGLIEQRPHQTGALIYTYPSPLHTELFARPQPGILLQTASVDIQSSRLYESAYIASFGGMTPVVRNNDRGGKLPLLDPNSEIGIDRERLGDSIANMRIIPGTVIVERPPLSVGANASGLNNTRLSAEAIVIGARAAFNKSNPYPPGTMEYVALEDGHTKSDLKAQPGPEIKQKIARTWSQKATPAKIVDRNKESGEKLISKLRNMVAGTKNS